MALPLYGNFKPVQTSNNSSNRKKEKILFHGNWNPRPPPSPPGSTHHQTKKELNYTLLLVTPGRTFLKMSRTHHSDFIETPAENSSKCQELII
jgi:hypothetical protein